MSRVIFADASYWIALLNSRDSLHNKAVRLSEDIQPANIVTSEMVLTEVLNDFSNRGEYLRVATANFIAQLRLEPNISIVVQTSQQLQDAMELYRQRPDKAWSHTDCMSFIIMKEYKITEALTFDQHFAQAGYIALMRR